MLNDVYVRGKENDLSAFSADFREPVELSIEAKNKQVSVSIDGEAVYKSSYSETMGELVGLRYKFNGLGEILDYEVIDQNNEVVSLVNR